MYGLPDTFDYCSLSGQVLRMVSYAEYSLYLQFEEMCTITIESSISVGESEIAAVTQHPVNILELLGKKIINAFGDNSGTLNLEFEDQKIVKIFEIGNIYESYTINIDGKVTIV